MTTNAKLTGARSVREVLEWSRQLAEPGLREAVATLPLSMQRMAGYHFGWWEADGCPTRSGTGGGKALRPALAVLASEAVGGEPEAAAPAAVAVELVHNFSLIQDDVIDEDLTRRHRPTVWSVFGAGPAIVVGDSLLALAFEVFASSDHTAAPEATRMLHRGLQELLDGQHADLTFEQRTDVDVAECVAMAEGKSGALLGAACALGALLGGGTAAQVAQLGACGRQLGVAFQLADDLLGIWGDPAVTGKPVYSDLQRRKKTLPLVAAMTSGTPAGAELAALYDRDSPLSDTELAHAAELVDQAGGRDWSHQRAEDLLADALYHLRAAADAGRAADELVALARLAAYRDH